MNLILVSVLFAWLVNQLAKVIITKHKKTFFECGGMPSSHSAFVSALCTSVGLLEGFGSAIFLITLAFSVLVAHDAVQIRKQHKVIDVMIGAAIGIAVTLIINAVLF